MAKSIVFGSSLGTKGEEHKQPHYQGKSILSRTPYDCIERSGETGRDHLVTKTRAAFMVENGLNRETFEIECAKGAGYKKWRAFAAEHGLNLPA